MIVILYQKEHEMRRTVHFLDCPRTAKQFAVLSETLPFLKNRKQSEFIDAAAGGVGTCFFVEWAAGP